MNQLIQTILSLQNSQQIVAHLPQGKRTYADLYRDVNLMATHLQQRTNQAWALWQEDGYDFLVNFLAMMLAGKKVVLPPNRTLATETWLTSQNLPFWDASVFDANHDLGPFAFNWQTTDWHSAPLTLFTSGSTGTPKPIERTFGQTACELDVLQQLFPWPHHTVVMATVSHQHMFGLYYKLFLTVQQGHAFVSTQCVYPEDLARYLANLAPKNTVLISSPAFLSRWQEPHSAQNYAHIFSAGSPLPAEVSVQLQRDIVEIFGSSESGGIAWKKPNQAWHVFPNVTTRIDDKEQLWVKTDHAYTPDWISTGDTARLCERGQNFELLGRVDRIVKLSEKRVSLDHIETQLQQHPWIEEAHARVLHQNEKVSLVSVCTLTQTGWEQMRQLGKHRFVQHLKQNLHAHLEQVALPKRWRFERALPRNSQSKLDHAAIVALFDIQKRPVNQNLRLQGNVAELDVWFPPELMCFQGHFPSVPVYPGVAQVDAIQHLARTLWMNEAACVGMEQLKFQKPILAYDLLHLTLERKAQKVIFKFTRNDTPVASGRLCFSESPIV